jgi:hypothetical protein
MKTSTLWGLSILLVGCSSGTIISQGEERKPVIDNWENVYLYFTPPANYEAIGMVSGKGRGLGDQSKMENAVEAMKEEARDAGATGILIQSAGMAIEGSVSTANIQSTSYGAYGFGATVPIVNGEASGLAIYVPSDAAKFNKAQQAHQMKCDNLSSVENALEAALKTAKKTGNPADVDAAKKNLQATEDEEDAEFCGEDAWYANQMASQQQLMQKMRAEDQASKDAEKNEADKEAQCLAAAQKNDLAAWRKLQCK